MAMRLQLLLLLLLAVVCSTHGKILPPPPAFGPAVFMDVSMASVSSYPPLFGVSSVVPLGVNYTTLASISGQYSTQMITFYDKPSTISLLAVYTLYYPCNSTSNSSSVVNASTIVNTLTTFSFSYNATGALISMTQKTYNPNLPFSIRTPKPTNVTCANGRVCYLKGSYGLLAAAINIFPAYTGAPFAAAVSGLYPFLIDFPSNSVTNWWAIAATPDATVPVTNGLLSSMFKSLVYLPVPSDSSTFHSHFLALAGSSTSQSFKCGNSSENYLPGFVFNFDLELTSSSYTVTVTEDYPTRQPGKMISVTSKSGACYYGVVCVYSTAADSYSPNGYSFSLDFLEGI